MMPPPVFPTHDGRADRHRWRRLQATLFPDLNRPLPEFAFSYPLPMNRRQFITVTASLAASLGALHLAGGMSPAKASSAGHRIHDLDLLDASRARPVPVRLYMPRLASPEQLVPLIVFSHGMGGSRAGYRYLGSHWAEQGIASLHPQHVGSDNSLWRGNPLDLVQRLQHAARDAEALARVHDLRFVVDHVLASEFGRLIDTTRIAAAGHSYGASTVMLASGARVTDASSHIADLRDERIRAAILISAPPFVGQGPIEQVLGSISIPTLHVTSIDDTIRIPGYLSTVEDRIAIFHAMSRSPKTLAVFNTGGHSIFTDRTTRSGPEASSRIKNATRELTTLFLAQAFPQIQRHARSEGQLLQAGVPSGTSARRDGAQDIAQWSSRHQDILERFITPETRVAAG